MAILVIIILLMHLQTWIKKTLRMALDYLDNHNPNYLSI